MPCFYLLPRQSGEAFLHEFDLIEISLQAMGPAQLVRRGPKSARGETLASLRAAQVNYRSEFLHLRQANLNLATRSQSIDHALVQVCGGHFDRMARQNSNIQTVEPTGTRIMPRAFTGDHVIPDAILTRGGECSVSDLKHAQRARCRPVNFKKTPRPLPAPVGTRHRISVALNLSQRSEKCRRDDARRMFLEKYSV